MSESKTHSRALHILGMVVEFERTRAENAHLSDTERALADEALDTLRGLVEQLKAAQYEATRERETAMAHEFDLGQLREQLEAQAEIVAAAREVYECWLAGDFDWDRLAAALNPARYERR